MIGLIRGDARSIVAGKPRRPSQPVPPELEDIDRCFSSGPPGPSRARRTRYAIAIWLGGALVLGALLATSAAGSGPLDDPDLAKQRSGMLDVVGPRSPAPMVAPGLPSPGRATVVFFVRPAQREALRNTLAASDARSLAAAADIAVVVSAPGPSPGGPPDGGPPVVADDDGRLAAGYGMRRPRDGGPPVGYAVVGRDRTVRYRTEDPGVGKSIDEVLIMVGALP